MVQGNRLAACRTIDIVELYYTTDDSYKRNFELPRAFDSKEGSSVSKLFGRYFMLFIHGQDGIHSILNVCESWSFSFQIFDSSNALWAGIKLYEMWGAALSNICEGRRRRSRSAAQVSNNK